MKKCSVYRGSEYLGEGVCTFSETLWGGKEVQHIYFQNRLIEYSDSDDPKIIGNFVVSIEWDSCINNKTIHPEMSIEIDLNKSIGSVLNSVGRVPHFKNKSALEETQDVESP